MKKKLKIITTILLLTTTYLVVAQTKPKDKLLSEKIKWLDFLTVQISHYSERYERQEINVIYHHDNTIKIHSILKSNYDKDKQIDTVFTLNRQQIDKIDNFGINFNNNNIPSRPVIAGTRTIFVLVLNGQPITIENKSDYSLIMDLLKK